MIVIALLLAATLGGGVSVAANQAMPGDALWGFKVNVNESIGSALSITDQSRAEWDLSLAEARLLEAQELAAKGELSTEAQAKVSANFVAHAEEVSDGIARLQSAGQYSAAANVAARFQSVLAANASTFAQLSAQAEGNAEASLAPLNTALRAALESASELSTQASAQAAAEGSDSASAAGGTILSGSEDASDYNDTDTSGEVRASGSLKVKGSDDSSVESETDDSVKVNVF